MPSNVAVHKPRTRVVSWECDDKPASTRQKGYIATRRICEIELRCIRVLVEDPSTISKNIEVVAVEMNGVRDWRFGSGGFLDNPVRPLLRTNQQKGLTLWKQQKK